MTAKLPKVLVLAASVLSASCTYGLLPDELVIDNFAGGGGASTGIEQAIGRPVDIAINHDPEAIAMHRINHPYTTHYCESVWDVDPVKIINGRPVGLVWLSPDCKHFSKAKGGKPVEKRIRGLAWIALRWVDLTRPRVLILENVEEFQTWGPLGKDGRPCPARKGKTFRSFVNALKRHGYSVEFTELRANMVGTPTIRKRFFLVARRDGLPIQWPAKTHDRADSHDVLNGKLQAEQTAADCIDWSIPCPSIFDRERPLADATCRRIAAGLIRYVVNSDKPFIVKCNHTAPGYDAFRGQSLDAPLPTLTAKNGFALVTAFIEKNYNGTYGTAASEPLHTIPCKPHHSLITSNLVKLRNNNIGQATNTPLHAVTAGGNHFGEVRAFLTAYYGSDKDGQALTEPMRTVPTRDRFGLVTIHGQQYQIVDIGFRMLQPHELFRAQGFPADYIIDRGINEHGKEIKLTKTAQTRMCGNSVCPPLAKALVEANFSSMSVLREIA